MLTVFYDGKCGLCRREIAHYQRISAVGTFEWVDITVQSHALEEKGVALKDGLKQLHVMDEVGVMHVGVDAFALMWERLPKPWPLAGRCIRLPLVYHVTRIFYRWFANWRYQKYGYDRCDL